MECIDGRMIESLETQRHPIAGKRRPAIKGLQDEEFRNSAPIGKALIQEVSKATAAQGGKACIIEYSCAFAVVGDQVGVGKNSLRFPFENGGDRSVVLPQKRCSSRAVKSIIFLVFDSYHSR